MNDDLFFLRHIVDEVRFLKANCKGVPKDKLLSDEVLRKAVQKSLENISVAVFNLSPDIKKRWELVDWEKYSRMQVDIKTRFLSIDHDLMVDIIKYEMPRLEKIVHGVVEKEYPGYMVKEGGGLVLPQA